MDIKQTIASLEKNGFNVHYYETAAAAADAISSELAGKTIGFGGSVTVKELGLYDKLSANNTVYWHWIDKDENTRKLAASAEVYITSANAISQTGEIVNIDGTGNRIAATLFGPQRVIFVVGVNKLTDDLNSAIYRARNIAAPLNAKRLNLKTPCAMSEPMRCHDCNSPQRPCHGTVIISRSMGGIGQTDVVLIGEKLGF